MPLIDRDHPLAVEVDRRQGDRLGQAGDEVIRALSRAGVEPLEERPLASDEVRVHVGALDLDHDELAESTDPPPSEHVAAVASPKASLEDVCAAGDREPRPTVVGDGGGDGLTLGPRGVLAAAIAALDHDLGPASFERTAAAGAEFDAHGPDGSRQPIALRGEAAQVPVAFRWGLGRELAFTPRAGFDLPELFARPLVICVGGVRLLGDDSLELGRGFVRSARFQVFEG